MPEEEKTLYLTLSSPISDQIANQLVAQVDTAIRSQKFTHLYILINSPGGSVNGGIFLYNYLRSLPIKITTHNLGQVDSIGNVIYLAGQDRFAAPATTFLLHGVTLTIRGQATMTRGLLEERLSQIKQDEKRIESIITDRTTLGVRKLAGFFRAGRSLSPSEALGYGIVTEIKIPEIPENAEHMIAASVPGQPPQN